jgi:ribosomal protein S18 acetylase RimI-like enzyme
MASFDVDLIHGKQIKAILGEIVELEEICHGKRVAWHRIQYEAIMHNPKLIFFIARDPTDGMLIGAAFALHSQGSFKKDLWLLGNIVHPRARRKGLGTTFVILRERIAMEHDNHTSIADVCVEDEASVGMLRSKGYRIAERIEGFYANEVDGFRMLKDLPPTPKDYKRGGLQG